MNTKEMRNIYDKFLDDISKGVKHQQDEINLLEIILKVANSLYSYSGESTGLTDSEYDELVEYLKDVTNSDDMISEKLVNKSEVTHHKFTSLRGTLDKIYKLTEEDVIKNKSEKSLDDWIKSTERRIRENNRRIVDITGADVMVTPKFDGVSCVFQVSKKGELKEALLRGDTSRNETHDVSHILGKIFEPPIKNCKYEYGLKTEIMMTEDDFKAYNEEYGTDYKNSRSIVSSILNSDEVDDRVNYLKIIPLRIAFMNKDGQESIQEMAGGIYNYPYLKCKLKDVYKIRKFSFDHKYVDGLRCDGSVITLTDVKYQQWLGRENERNKFEVAFKFTEEVGYSKVTDVMFTTGLFGTLNPVVKFKPIKLKGNTVEKASLGSYARFKELGLAKGDVVKISYDIIPYVNFDIEDENCTKSGNPAIEPPLKCPSCDTYYVENKAGTSYVCPNRYCPSREKGKYLNYCNKMKIENVSYATIEDFYDNDIIEGGLSSLYGLSYYANRIMKIPGYGPKKTQIIIDSIESRRTTYPSELFGSLGIEGISKKTFRSVFKFYTIDEVIDLCKHGHYEAFTICKGIKDKTAMRLVQGVNENRDEIKDLREVLKILPEPAMNDNGLNVVFSKVRNPELEQYIIDNGGNVSTSVSSRTSFVIVPNFEVTSSKIEKAKELGLPIILESNARAYLDDKFL